MRALFPFYAPLRIDVRGTDDQPNTLGVFTGSSCKTLGPRLLWQILRRLFIYTCKSVALTQGACLINAAFHSPAFFFIYRLLTIDRSSRVTLNYEGGRGWAGGQFKE
jgi:hypothetical protein